MSRMPATVVRAGIVLCCVAPHRPAWLWGARRLRAQAVVQRRKSYDMPVTFVYSEADAKLFTPCRSGLTVVCTVVTPQQAQLAQEEKGKEEGGGAAAASPLHN
jgi:hypothetical protein|eukprot:COSAG01_NODE_8655_length_2706_cov_12.197929_3_plen_103_part_00